MELKATVDESAFDLIKIFFVEGLHYQYPNNDPEFFNSHSPNDDLFHPSNGENHPPTGKDSLRLQPNKKCKNIDQISADSLVKKSNRRKRFLSLISITIDDERQFDFIASTSLG